MSSEKKQPGKNKKTEDKPTLVIVESPAKAKTIERYLGSSYTVLASMGHLIDLPKSRLGVDVEHGFIPEYLTIRGKAKLLKEIIKNAKKSGKVYLASDNDREGEAISWHIHGAIEQKLPDLKIQRIVFNEITSTAIRNAVKVPTDIDEDKVNAQKARRVLDRLVGYNLSPILWKKVKNGLSAGRVQSVALRIICEKEDEVEAFIPEEYWTLEADFKKGKALVSANLISYKGSKVDLKNEASVNEIITAISDKVPLTGEIKESERYIKPKAPFTTSTLQQTAANKLGFTSKKTMQIAQQLYEGINIGNNRLGLISYMRTDSVRVSDTALNDVREWIKEHYPAELPKSANVYTSEKKAQDAHEAIRPTQLGYTPESIKDYLSKDQYKLYAIIWERFVSSQMNSAKQRTNTIDIIVGDAIFRASASRLVEKGYYKVIKLLAIKEDKEKILPAIKTGEELVLEAYRPEQHFTQGPTRFTDASIIKMLEENGIGRPSTYAPIISVLLERYYVTRENKQLVPTSLGRKINEILVGAFPDVVDTGFTAEMELMLDRVEEMQKDWVSSIEDFYTPFKKKVDEIMESLESFKGSLDEPTNEVCDKCGKPMVKKLGRFGYFLACSGFPECMNTKSIALAKCPRPGCNGHIVSRRKAKGKGREFFGCSNFPECDFVTYYKPSSSICPKCSWFLVERYHKKKGSYKACINPDCDYLHSQDEEHVDTD